MDTEAKHFMKPDKPLYQSALHKIFHYTQDYSKSLSHKKTIYTQKRHSCLKH